MSTINVDDNLYLKAVDAAKLQGRTVEEFVGETLRHAVGQTAPQAAVVRQTIRNGLPVMVFNGTSPAFDLRAVRESLEEEGF
jgi:hypothetical protein